MSFVLDASIAISWCFHDEATEKTNTLLEKLEKSTAIVPSIWHLEVSNVLLMAEKHKRITYAGILEFFSLIEGLLIEVDTFTSEKSFNHIFSVAYEEKLTVYDAAYLELAMRRGLPLATKDKALLNAAKRKHIKIAE